MPLRSWDSCGDKAPCRRLVGVLWGFQKPLTSLADQTQGTGDRNFRRLMIAFRGNPASPCALPAQGNSAPCRIRAASAEGATGECWDQNILIWALPLEAESRIDDLVTGVRVVRFNGDEGGPAARRARLAP